MQASLKHDRGGGRKERGEREREGRREHYS